MIKLRNIHKSYFLAGREEPVLKGIDLTVNKGEVVALMGPSGSGKSTMMNIIGMLDRPTSGEYFLNEQNIGELDNDYLADLRNQHLGFVFQQFLLLPRLNALHNVALPLIYRGVSLNDRRALAKDKLSKVGLGDLWHHKPAELSGGQQQRVAIARAIVGDPNILLADEPTGALDTKTGNEIMTLLKQLNEQEGTTIIMVTHDPEVAKQCERIVHLQDGVII